MIKSQAVRGRRTARPAARKKPVDMGMLEEVFGYHLRRAQVAVFEDFMQTMVDSRLTPGQFGVLVLIERNDGLSQSALARALGKKRSTMVVVIDGLEDRGLIIRRPSTTDGRSYALALSAQGKSLLAEIKPRVRRHEKRLTTDLQPADVDTLIDLLKRITEQSRK